MEAQRPAGRGPLSLDVLFQIYAGVERAAAPAPDAAERIERLVERRMRFLTRETQRILGDRAGAAAPGQNLRAPGRAAPPLHGAPEPALRREASAQARPSFRAQTPAERAGRAELRAEAAALRQARMLRTPQRMDRAAAQAAQPDRPRGEIPLSAALRRERRPENAAPQSGSAIRRAAEGRILRESAVPARRPFRAHGSPAARRTEAPISAQGRAQRELHSRIEELRAFGREQLVLAGRESAADGQRIQEAPPQGAAGLRGLPGLPGAAGRSRRCGGGAAADRAGAAGRRVPPEHLPGRARAGAGGRGRGRAFVPLGHAGAHPQHRARGAPAVRAGAGALGARGEPDGAGRRGWSSWRSGPGWRARALWRGGPPWCSGGCWRTWVLWRGGSRWPSGSGGRRRSHRFARFAGRYGSARSDRFARRGGRCGPSGRARSRVGGPAGPIGSAGRGGSTGRGGPAGFARAAGRRGASQRAGRCGGGAAADRAGAAGGRVPAEHLPGGARAGAGGRGRGRTLGHAGAHPQYRARGAPAVRAGAGAVGARGEPDGAFRRARVPRRGGPPWRTWALWRGGGCWPSGLGGRRRSHRSARRGGRYGSARSDRFAGRGGSAGLARAAGGRGASRRAGRCGDGAAADRAGAAGGRVPAEYLPVGARAGAGGRGRGGAFVPLGHAGAHPQHRARGAPAV